MKLLQQLTMKWDENFYLDLIIIMWTIRFEKGKKLTLTKIE